MSARYDLLIEQGSDFDETLTWAIGEVPVDLTGWSGAMQVRSEWESPDVIFEATLTLGGSEGTIRIQIPGAASSMIDPLRYRYDLLLTGPGNTRKRLLAGSLTVDPAVTR